jgi:hypothetical protein
MTILAIASLLGTARSVGAAPVTSEVRVGGETFRYHAGPCVRRSGYVTVTFAPVREPSARPRPAAFRLTLGRLPRQGAGAEYVGAVASAVGSGRMLAIGHAHVTVAPGGARGTFAAQLVRSTKPLAGSFAC